jgi:acylglycerol lipase
VTSSLIFFQPATPPKAKLIFIHGFSDHVNRYYELFPTLASRGIEVHGFDQRGWGRSSEVTGKGHSGPTPRVIADVAAFIRSQLPSEVPVFLMGHSMGGAEVLTLACSPEYADITGQLRGLLTESAHLGFPAGGEPSSITVMLGRLAGRILPKFRKVHIIDPKLLTRDPAVQKSLTDDELCHNTGTLEGLAGLLDRAENLSTGNMRVNDNLRSLWISHGTGDQCTSCPASKKFLEAQTHIQDREFKPYEGWSHQLHADLPDNRGIFAKDVGDWILARSSDGERSKL